MVNQCATHCFVPFCAASSHNLSQIDKTKRPGNTLASWLVQNEFSGELNL